MTVPPVARRCVEEIGKLTVPLDVVGSLMCGDAAGRPRDFSGRDSHGQWNH